MSDFFYRNGNLDANVTRFKAALAGEELLDDDQAVDALRLMKGELVREGLFSPEDDFLQTLFAVDNLENLLITRREFFEAHLEAFFLVGADYESNLQRFLERRLVVQNIQAENPNELVQELKQILIAQRIIEVEETDQNSLPKTDRATVK